MWFAQRRWLPRRPYSVIPVTSTLPLGDPETVRPTAPRARIGVFGFGHEGVQADAVAAAVASLRRRERDAHLVLVGYPGQDSGAGRLWAAAARRHDLAAVEFTGPLPAPDAIQALRRCTLLVSAYATGPESRRSSLAAGLGLAIPVVALDGPETWAELRQADAVHLTDAAALADTLDGLLENPGRLRALGQRGRSFYEQRMSPAKVAANLLSALDGSDGS
jgi:glycosyltransferase involved in cell wall biosynthesis